MGIEQLENKGFAFLNTENINNDKRQIVVVGSARGGTSLVAGALHHLGVFTGDKSNPPVFEDVLLSEAFESNEIDKAKSIVERYSESHDLWAWKRPAALNYLDKVELVIPNPLYIFIFKDIFAIANRNNISMKSDISKGLENAISDYCKIVDFVGKTNRPVMLVSAEKALQNKKDFVNALVSMNMDICDLSTETKNAIEFITPNPKQYLDVTRNSKVIGQVGYHDEVKINGWARYLHTKKHVEVELYLGGKLVETQVADQYRAHQVSESNEKQAFCGFSFDIEGLDSELNIEVYGKGDVSPIFELKR